MSKNEQNIWISILPKKIYGWLAIPRKVAHILHIRRVQIRKQYKFTPTRRIFLILINIIKKQQNKKIIKKKKKNLKIK